MSKNPDTTVIQYTAGGGVVLDEDGTHVLLLIRPARDEVRLPKGHVEPDEQPREAALREVREETGYADLVIRAALGQQQAVFHLEGRRIQRREIYYLMQLKSRHQVVRPPADAQFFPIWVAWDESLQHLTFEIEKEWIRRAHRTWKELS